MCSKAQGTDLTCSQVVVGGGVVYWYSEQEKERQRKMRETTLGARHPIARRRAHARNPRTPSRPYRAAGARGAAGIGVGKPDIGGPFDLIDQNGKRCQNTDFLGKWVFIYFGCPPAAPPPENSDLREYGGSYSARRPRPGAERGGAGRRRFTYCPDICPNELTRLREIMDMLDASPETKDKVVPLFITIDPERDGPLQLKEYLADWHPKMIGLTGPPEKIAKARPCPPAATRALARAAPAPGAQQGLTRARGK